MRKNDLNLYEAVYASDETVYVIAPSLSRAVTALPAIRSSLVYIRQMAHCQYVDVNGKHHQIDLPPMAAAFRTTRRPEPKEEP